MDNKADFISLAGLRPDGRRGREIRRVRCRFGVFKVSDRPYSVSVCVYVPILRATLAASSRVQALQEKATISVIHYYCAAHNIPLLLVPIARVHLVARAIEQHNNSTVVVRSAQQPD